MLVKDRNTVAGKMGPATQGDQDESGTPVNARGERLTVEAVAARFEAGDQQVWSWLRDYLLHEQEFLARRLIPGDIFPGIVLPATEALAHTAAKEPDWSVESTWWLDDQAVTVLLMCSRPSSGEVWTGLCRAPRTALRSFFAHIGSAHKEHRSSSGQATRSPVCSRRHAAS